MKSLMILVLSVLNPILAQPVDTTQSTISDLTSSFKIQILTPSSPIPEPIYLTPNGSTTAEKSLAAKCTVSTSTELYCGSEIVPVGGPLGAPAALFSGVRSSDQAPHPGMGGKLVTTGFKIDAQTSRIGWTNSNFKGGIGFAFRSDESQSIWAVFTKTALVDSLVAELVAVFD